MNVCPAFWIGLFILGGTVVTFAEKSAEETSPASEPIIFRAVIQDSLTGKPVPGIILSTKKPTVISAISDLNGELTIPGISTGPIDLEVSAAKAGYCRWWSEDAKEPWQKLKISKGGKQRNFDNLTFDLNKNKVPVVITMEKGVLIRGKVFDPNGAPVENATVSDVETGTSNSLSGDSRFSTLTKSDGTYEAFLPASGQSSYNLMAHDGMYGVNPKNPRACYMLGWRKWANGTVAAFKTVPGQVVQNLDIRLNYPYKVSGRVINKLGQPVANHELRCLPTTGDQSRLYTPTASTLKDGSFTFNFVSEGAHCVQAEPFRVSALGTIKLGDTAKQVTIGENSKSNELELIVVDKSTSIIRYNPNLELEAGNAERPRPFSPMPKSALTETQSKFVDTLIQALETRDPILFNSLFTSGPDNQSYADGTTNRILKLKESFADIEITLRDPSVKLTERQAENPAWLPNLSAICVIKCDGARKDSDILKSDKSNLGHRIIGSSTSYLYLSQIDGQLFIATPHPQSEGH